MFNRCAEEERRRECRMKLLEKPPEFRPVRRAFVHQLVPEFVEDVRDRSRSRTESLLQRCRAPVAVLSEPFRKTRVLGGLLFVRHSSSLSGDATPILPSTHGADHRS